MKPEYDEATKANVLTIVRAKLIAEGFDFCPEQLQEQIIEELGPVEFIPEAGSKVRIEGEQGWMVLHF